MTRKLTEIQTSVTCVYIAGSKLVPRPEDLYLTQKYIVREGTKFCLVGEEDADQKGVSRKLTRPVAFLIPACQLKLLLEDEFRTNDSERRETDALSLRRSSMTNCS